MDWIKAREGDLDEGDRQVVELQGQKVLILKENGTLYAMQHNCPHMGASLKRGKIESGNIICPLHRSAFDLETGAVQAWAPWPPVVGSVLGAVKQEHALKTYPAKLEDGAIWIAIDPEI